MSLPPNRFKARLKAGETQIGLWLALGNGYTAELCAGAGFDFVLIDAEHGPNTLTTVLQQLQGVAATRSHAIVRPPIGDSVLIKQYLDVGAQTLLVPMVESGEQAKHLVEAMRYPPAGFRGVGNTIARAARWGRHADYLEKANAEVCFLPQIETIPGIQNVDAIAGTEGVDGVFVGTSDLAAAMGHLGNPSHSDVQAAVADCILRIKAKGKGVGLLTSDEAQAKGYIAQGATFVAVGSDAGLLTRATAALAKSFLGDKASEGPDKGGY